MLNLFRMSRTSVRSRIIIRFGVIVVLVLMAQTFTHWVEVMRRDRVEAMRADFQGEILDFFTLLRQVDEAARILGERLRGEGDDADADLNHLRVEIQDRLEELHDQIEHPAIRRVVQHTLELHHEVTGATDVFLVRSHAASGEVDLTPEEELVALTDLWSRGTLFMDSMIRVAEMGADAFAGEVAVAQVQSGYLRLANTAIHSLVFVISAFLVFTLGRSITKPIDALHAGVSEFSHGNLSATVSVPGDDEFARLAECFEEMSSRIQRMLSEGKRVSDLSLMVCASLDTDQIAHRLLNVVRQLTGGRLIVLTMQSVDQAGWARYTSRDYDDCTREDLRAFDEGQLEEMSLGAHSVIQIPLMAQERVVGSLEIRDHSGGEAIVKQTNMVSSILVSVSMALRNAQYVMQLREEKERVARHVEALSVAYAQLEEHQRFKSQFLAGMSHRLRTPLNGVMGCTDLMAGGVLGEITEKQAEALSTVKRCSQILLGSIDQILNYSRLESGDIEMLWREFDVAEIIERALSHVGHSLQEREITPEITVAPEVAQWLSDPVKVRLIVQYLTEHAACSPGVTALWIDARPREMNGERWLDLQIRDNGDGATPDQIAKMFEPFQTGDDKSGAGLSLTISRRLVELLGGSIQVDSKVGSGSTFALRVPHHGEL